MKENIKSWLFFLLAMLALTLFWHLLGSFFSTKTEEITGQETDIQRAEPDEREFHVGEIIDSLHGVYVFYVDDDIFYEAEAPTVEFVKRYYEQKRNLAMPDETIFALDFFDKKLRDGQKNRQTKLLQFKNPSMTPPTFDDILVLNADPQSPHGHLAIVSNIHEDAIEIIQQNPADGIHTRSLLHLKNKKGLWHIQDSLVLGWLRQIPQVNSRIPNK